MTQPPVLPVEALQALERGNLLEAIKLLRKSRGLGLREAKELVEAVQRGDLKLQPGTVVEVQIDTAPGKPEDVMEALRAGNKIEAIRRMRANTGLGLKESKDAVDAMEAGAALAGKNGLAPGQVADTGGSWWPWIALAAVAGGLYYFLR